LPTPPKKTALKTVTLCSNAPAGPSWGMNGQKQRQFICKSKDRKPMSCKCNIGNEPIKIGKNNITPKEKRKLVMEAWDI